ncbi:O-methyltransferase [Methylomagnum sp.]
MTNHLLQLFSRRRKPSYKIAKIRDDSNLDIVLPWALAKSEAAIRFPVAYVELLRTCLEIKTLSITTVKSKGEDHNHDYVRHFAALLGALADLPPLELAVAEKLAQVADSLFGDTRPVESGSWAGDISAHFAMSSSFGHKGRILATIIRFMRCGYCLELGTAYGMSALFMLEALAVNGPDTRLITVEGSELAHQITSELLENRYPGRVSCEYGWTSQVLPRLAQTLNPLDFLFHDAGHSRNDYINDFQTLLPLLPPGAVVLFDDINWYDPRFASTDPQCHKGWLEVANHPRVLWAVEMDQEMGLVLLK